MGAPHATGTSRIKVDGRRTQNLSQTGRKCKRADESHDSCIIKPSRREKEEREREREREEEEEEEEGHLSRGTCEKWLNSGRQRCGKKNQHLGDHQTEPMKRILHRKSAIFHSSPCRRCHQQRKTNRRIHHHQTEANSKFQNRRNRSFELPKMNKKKKKEGKKKKKKTTTNEKNSGTLPFLYRPFYAVVPEYFRFLFQIHPHWRIVWMTKTGTLQLFKILRFGQTAVSNRAPFMVNICIPSFNLLMILIRSSFDSTASSRFRYQTGTLPSPIPNWFSYKVFNLNAKK